MADLIRRVLIANRGEIAIRIARAARELDIVPLGIASEADEHALHREAMDESLIIGPARASESYLHIERIITAAKTMRADAVHPGYGFLSERADFAQAVVDAGMIFIGPSAATLAAAGDKRRARQIAHESGIVTLDGYDGDDLADDKLLVKAQELGFPVLIKATNGGGGRGQRAVHHADDFLEAIAAARREAKAAFGDDSVLLERYVEHPRHIEFQILADSHGNVVHAGERDCSLQRRRQKVLEEAPAAGLSNKLRKDMANAAIALAHATNYVGVGTVEFLVDKDDRFYFLEINARLQVEHPVTELVHGIDLVAEQFRIANGEELSFADTDPRGCAIEARICAEDPAHDLLPSCGTITRVSFPAGSGIRVDSGIASGSIVPVDYDSLLAKLSVWAETREAAIKKLASALSRTKIDGIATNISTLRAILADGTVKDGTVHTTYLDESGLLKPERAEYLPASELVIFAAQSLLQEDPYTRVGSVGIPLFFQIDGEAYAIQASRKDDVWECISLRLPGISSLTVAPFTCSATETAVRPDGDDSEIVPTSPLAWRDPNRRPAAARASDATSITVTSPMPGRVLRLEGAVGSTVDEHDVVAVLEAMKMEHRIEAGLTGTITQVHVKQGDTVAAGAPILEISK